MSDRLPSPQGVIFDLDGTLADTLADLVAAVNHALAELDRPAISAEQVRLAIGGGLADATARAAGTDDPATVQALMDAFWRYYADHCLDRTQLYPGIPDVLDALHARAIPLAILSNKPQAFTERIAAALLERWPWVEIAGEREGIAVKPDPAPALALAERMGVPAAAVHLVGDSGVDVETGRRAGMVSVACTWGLRTVAELEASAPTAWVHEPRELLSLWGLDGIQNSE